jgi:tetratricopeptide (TPR) repeat protein
MKVPSKTKNRSSTGDITARINAHMKSRRWSEARALLKKELKKKPDSHWCCFTIGDAYYHEKKFSRALIWYIRARELASHCSYANYSYAKCLELMKRYDEAIPVFRAMIRKGPKRFAHGRCSDGIVYAREIVNEARFRVGLCYSWIGDYKSALRWYFRHTYHRFGGVRSPFKLRFVKDMIVEAMIGKDKNTRTRK